MSLSMPMWPPIFITAAPAHVARPTPAPTPPPIRRRWMIVEDNVRREVEEREYGAALASCNGVEVARYPHEEVITHLCYRTKS